MYNLKLKGQIETHGNKTFPALKAVSFKSQVVAGTNYYVKVHTGGDDHIHVSIHRPLPHTGEAPHVRGVQTNKTHQDEISFF